MQPWISSESNRIGRSWGWLDHHQAKRMNEDAACNVHGALSDAMSMSHIFSPHTYRGFIFVLVVGLSRLVCLGIVGRRASSRAKARRARRARLSTRWTSLRCYFVVFVASLSRLFFYSLLRHTAELFNYSLKSKFNPQIFCFVLYLRLCDMM